MFKPLAMKHVLLQMLTEELPQAALTLAELGTFDPDFRPVFNDSFPRIPGERYREIYRQACARLEKISEQIDLSGMPGVQEIEVITEQELAATNEWLGKVWERCSAFEESFRALTAEQRMVDQLNRALDNFAALNIDLSLLKGEKIFLDIHIGILPKKNVAHLKEAIGLASYLLFSYMEAGENTHVVILGPKGKRERDTRSVLDTAGFRDLPIPEELHDEPETVRLELQQRQEKIIEDHREQLKAMEACGHELRAQLQQASRKLILAKPFVDLDTAARSSGHLAIISGWMPSREIRRTEQALGRALETPFRLESRNPRPDERGLVPSYLPKNLLMKPFVTLVKQYGVPRYGEIDPTAIFALTFIAMFGMMFGDVGHGLVIMILAWLVRRRLKSFTLFALCAGFSAALFGLLYGSIFGYEHIFPAIWIPPLSDPIYMLSMALAWGVVFLVVITLLCIHNRIVAGEYHRALFDTNGLVSITLYLSVLGGLYNLHANGVFGLPATVLSLLSLSTLFAYKLIEIDAPPGERMLVAAIETFETLTGYASNTLSFLRVAAFSLNHVALAIAVFTLADMMSSAGQVLMVIGGNIFILVLEGAIVSIQALRLEYYEGFSRFFSGDGKEFRPLRLNLGNSS